MHVKKENLPITFEAPGVKFQMQAGQGKMAIAYAQMPAGPIDPVLEGLPNNSCFCPHWGYLFKGQMTIKYDDGSQEVIKAGDVYYIPAGHSGTIDEDAVALEFSPEREYVEVLEHVKNKMQTMA